MEDKIYFYELQGPHGFLSNYYPRQFYLKGREWPTTEHYFQAKKFEGSPKEEAVRNARTPGEAATMGRTRDVAIRADWEAVKYGVMREANLAKFSQHADLKRQLLETGDRLIVEHTADDKCWGDGGDGSGLNLLGKVLMEVRDEIRSRQA